MPPKIASTVFKTGPDDKAAVVDVYRANTAETINAAKASVSETVGNGVTAVNEIVSSGAVKAFEAAKQNLAETFYIGNLVETAKEAIIEGRLDTDKLKEGLLKNFPTKEDAISRLKDAIGEPFNTVANLEDLKTNLVTNLLGSVGFTDNPEALAKGLLGLPGGTEPINALLDQNPKLKVLYGTTQLIRDGRDIKDAKGFVNLANTVLGNSELAKILDAEAQFKVLGNLVDLASSYRMPQIFDEVTAKLENMEEKRRFLLGQLDTALNYGDLDLIRLIVTENGRDKVLAKNPRCINLILQNYTLPDETKVPRQQDYNNLLEVLDILNPNWDKYRRGNVLVNDLGVFASAGEPAKSVFNLNAVYREYYMFLEAYPSEDLMVLAKRNYPRTGLPIAA